MRYLFVILSLLGFMTLSESIPAKRVGNGTPAARRVIVHSAAPAPTTFGEVTAFEDGTPSPRR